MPLVKYHLNTHNKQESMILCKLNNFYLTSIDTTLCCKEITIT